MQLSMGSGFASSAALPDNNDLRGDVVPAQAPNRRKNNMRLTAGVMLAAFALAVPAVAQTKGQEVKPKVDTEKLWRIECSGISG